VWSEEIERAQYFGAAIQATLHNAHFDPQGVPWTADDFMPGKADREKRKREHFADRMETQRIKAASFVSNEDPDIPDWALELAANRKLVN
jgi:hypothetical protein